MATTERSLDRDLYCLSCGYNLRGLIGDPVRCPECGYLNPVEDIVVPARMIRNQLRKMESAPAWVVAAIILGSPCVLQGFLLMIESLAEKFVNPVEIVLGALIMLVPILIAVFSATQFRAGCLAKPNWLSALLKYIGWAILLLVTCIGGFIGLCYGLAASRSTRESPTVFVIAIAVFLIGTIFWTRWVYRKATGAITPLQREVAIDIARKQIRKKMTRKPRRLSDWIEGDDARA